MAIVKASIVSGWRVGEGVGVGVAFGIGAAVAVVVTVLVPAAGRDPHVVAQADTIKAATAKAKPTRGRLADLSPRREARRSRRDSLCEITHLRRTKEETILR